MKAFLLSILILLVVAIGAAYLFDPLLETPASQAYSTENVRL